MAFRLQLRSHEKPWLCMRARPKCASSYAGASLLRGFFRSRQTARYPESFCSSFVAHVQVLLSKPVQAFHMQDALALVPRKGLQPHPWAVHDGAGRHSQADWSTPQSSDCLKLVRDFSASGHSLAARPSSPLAKTPRTQQGATLQPCGSSCCSEQVLRGFRDGCSPRCLGRSGT